jgi:ATP-dependent Clp protease protease subunit
VLDKRALVVDILAQNTGQTPEKIAKDMDRMFYMTPQDAKDYGLIDQLLQSTKELVKPIPVST